MKIVHAPASPRRVYQQSAMLMAMMAAGIAASLADEPATANLRSFIPTTISPQARAIYEKLLPIAAAHRAEAKIPHTLAEFDARHDSDIARTEAATLATLKSLNIAVREPQLGGVNLIESTPPHFRAEPSSLLDRPRGVFLF